MTAWDKKNRSTEGEKSTMDDFWDVEKLLPERPVSRPVPKPRPAPTAVEVELASPQPAASGNASSPRAEKPVAAAPLTVTPRGAEAQTGGGSNAKRNGGDSAPTVEYEPDGALLHRVRVYGWQANYHYFDSFVEDALRYHAMKPPATAEKVSFFSYFPQYVQLNRRTTAWYLFWRENVRCGRYPDTDYAYILLYLFELINLPAETRAEALSYRDAMANVWMAYRRAHPQLDHYMCEWLCDYCLIHELTAPVDLLAPALDDIIMGSRLKEFYLSAAVRIPHGGESDEEAARATALATAQILMRHCCQYDYRKSKFASGEHKSLFDSTIPAAVAHALPLLFGVNGRKPAITMLDSTLTRDAYMGALCSYRNKRRIEVAYTSFSRSHELRFLIGDMVKHVENRLRSWIGVRSKLSVMTLPTPLRDALDAYLAPLEPPKSAVPVKKKEEPRPAYEALYDLPRKAVSLEDAAAIEAQSWETTRILVEAFGEEVNQPQAAAESTSAAVPSPAPAAPPAPPFSIASTAPTPAPVHDPLPAAASGVTVPPMTHGDAADTASASPLAPYAPFIKAALDGDSTALRNAAKAMGKMPDALADEINALTADGEIGDIILEDDGMGGYAVIEDYRDAVLEMIEG